MKLVDLHCDTLGVGHLAAIKGEPFSLEKNSAMVDIQKMQMGNYLAQFFAVFVPTKEMFTEDTGIEDPDLFTIAKEMIQIYHRELALHGEWIAPALNAGDLERNRAVGKISAFLTLEGVQYLDSDLSRVSYFYEKGVRLISLIWNFENCLAFPNSKNPEVMKKGLKPFGFEVVKEMNRLGMIVDVSHLSDGSFWDCIQTSSAPVIASHSNARSLCDDPRNLTDEMLRALADQGGVTGINYAPQFLREGEDPLGRGVTRLKDLLDQILYIRNVAGIDVLSLGSDFDGIYGTLEVKDASKVGLIVDGLEKAGLSGGEIDKVVGENALRVIGEVCL